MNTEEKAKAYDEALKDMQAIYPKLNGDMKLAVEHAFPQLAESEDERIRKALIEVFKEKLERGFEWVEYGIPNRSVLSWLEKQKECVADNSKTSTEEDERIRLALIKLMTVAGDRYVMSATGFEKERLLAYLEKQKEQKIVYEDEYQRMLSDSYKCGKDEVVGNPEKYGLQKEQPKEELVYRLNGLMQDYIKEGKDDEEKEHRFKCYQLFWDALENTSYFEQKEQKPMEWSEEDNIGWGEAFACVTKTERAAKDEGELQNAVTAEKWLKEIKFKYCVHPQSEQEWSEEDELMIKCCLRAIEHYKYTWKRNVFRPSQFNIDGDLTSPEKVQTWLESLRNRVGKESLQPHWKPSDEQIRPLEYAIEYFKKKKNYVTYLESLYEDLKKLM